MAVNLSINDEPRTYLGDPRVSLLEVLRETFRLTGAKDVCGQGFCGACTVHIDGEAVPACLRPIGLLEGAEVTTIEGLSPLGSQTALQEALLKHDVVQCGRCFPGLVMSLSKFIEQNGPATREDLQVAMTGNLCRCTGYENIVDAVMTMFEGEGVPK
jgi:carbon-monoxide dehydrogenase small subunit